MPRYDYNCEGCGEIIEVIHSITECDRSRSCNKCGVEITRMLSAPHVEGSSIYPFKLWNAKMPEGQYSIELKNKSEHKKFLKNRDLDSPSITNWGTRRVTA